jgi:hypothetical protein
MILRPQSPSARTWGLSGRRSPSRRP